MNSLEHIGSRELSPEQMQAGDFQDIRRHVSERLFNDPSFTVFDAMFEMSEAAEDYLAKLSTHFPSNMLWVGGSLGRREMMPNSDIDLFVIYDDEDQPRNEIIVHGVDKFEIGHITKNRLRGLLQYSYVDANRFIDGRGIGLVPVDEIGQMIREVNTEDRQHANNICEYFYYRYFDFTQKTTDMGPNLKYSTGSSRDTIFFNMMSRIETGEFPAFRGRLPEIISVMRNADENHGVAPPFEAVNMIFTVKNAAISVFDKTGDRRSKYVSHHSLGLIYDFCRDKFVALGYKDADHFIQSYKAARREIEFSVDSLFNAILNNHPDMDTFKEIIDLPTDELVKRTLNIIEDAELDNPQSLISFTSWMLMRRRPATLQMDAIARSLMTQSIDRVWGGLMAVACSPDTSDEVLSDLSDWLYENEKGAYLLKLITRNPKSSQETKQKALRYYRDKEIIM
jgi:hypothetical protein